MATVTKDFRVKNGLVVEGSTATVNGSNVLTEASTEFIQDTAAALLDTSHSGISFTYDDATGKVSASVSSTPTFSTEIIFEGVTADSFETTLNVTDPTADRTITLPNASGTVALTSDVSAAQTAAEDYADGLASNYDPAGSASAAQSAAESYADGLAVNYDAAGSAATAESNANTYTDNRETAITTAYQSYADTAEADAKSYADGLASNYDAAGSAATAESNANTYTDTALGNYTTTANLDTTIDGYGYLKSADLTGYASESYVDTAVSNLVDAAPSTLDTLNELAAALQDNPDVITDLQSVAAGKQDALTAGSNIDITDDIISVTGLASTDISDFNSAALSATSAAYDAAGSASTAETNANTYTDGEITSLETSLQAYADQAEVDAKAYTDTREGLITTAYQAYADQAEADAISTAASDATTKANAAQSAAEATASGLVDDVLDGTSAFSVVTLTDALMGTATQALTNTSATVVDSWSATTYSGAKYLVQMKNGNDIEILEILVAVDGNNNVYLTEYADVISNAELGTTDADYSGGNVRLKVTSTNGTTVKVHKTLIEA